MRCAAPNPHFLLRTRLYSVEQQPLRFATLPEQLKLVRRGVWYRDFDCSDPGYESAPCHLCRSNFHLHAILAGGAGAITKALRGGVCDGGEDLLVRLDRGDRRGTTPGAGTTQSSSGLFARGGSVVVENLVHDGGLQIWNDRRAPPAQTRLGSTLS